jgi:hypothetical protein
MQAGIAKRDFRKHLTLAAMSLGYGVVQLDVTIVNVAIDSIGRSFGGGVTALQWVVMAGLSAGTFVPPLKRSRRPAAFRSAFA